jgi:heme exporter protein A
MGNGEWVIALHPSPITHYPSPDLTRPVLRQYEPSTISLVLASFERSGLIPRPDEISGLKPLRTRWQHTGFEGGLGYNYAPALFRIPMLQARQIECTRGNRRLFHDLSFRLEAKQALRIRGENGTGKTSLLRMAAGLSPVEGGEILWNDARIAQLGEDYRRDLLFLGHVNGLKDDLSAVENLQHSLALAGTRAGAAELRTALAEQGLAVVADIPVKLLSQGQKRRAALVRLDFSADKPLWILDEPFSALDAASVARIEKVIVEHLHLGGMVLFTTHHEVELAGAQLQSVELGVC